MSEKTQTMFRYVEPGTELPEGSEVVTDEALIALNRDHFGAVKWAVENREAFFFLTAVMPSLQFPDQRAHIYAGVRALYNDLSDDLENHGPTNERTQLVLWVERPEAPSLGLVQP